MADHATHLVHVTRAGERWDQVAARYYGDPYAYEPIVRANPDVPIVPVLPAGLELLVPLPAGTAGGTVGAAAAAEVAAADLPPWKR